LETATAFIDRAVAAEARKANAMYVRKRTVAYKDTHQKNVSALRKHIKHNLTQTKAIIMTSRTSTNNTQSFVKKTIRTSITKPSKPLF
jgi:DNA-binding NtrC family response regulator